MNLAELLDELAVAPRLPGARCAGRHELFDATIEGSTNGAAGAAEVAAARAEALRLCAGCPELTPCGAWLDSLRPKDQPLGVVAGRLTSRTPRRTPREGDTACPSRNAS